MAQGETECHTIHSLSVFWLVPNWPISRLILIFSALIMLNLLKHNFWRKEKKNMICPVTILHLRCSFILTPSLNKNWIHRISIRSNWKTPYFNGSGWRAGIICPTKEQQPMGVKRCTSIGGTWQRVNWTKVKKKAIQGELNKSQKNYTNYRVKVLKSKSFLTGVCRSKY